MYGVRYVVGAFSRYLDTADLNTAMELTALLKGQGYDADWYPVKPRTAAEEHILRYGGKKP